MITEETPEGTDNWVLTRLVQYLSDKLGQPVKVEKITDDHYHISLLSSKDNLVLGTTNARHMADGRYILFGKLSGAFQEAGTFQLLVECHKQLQHEFGSDVID